jgi:pimeloyl-ACP methyl ester carboxylesterase
LEGDDRPPSNWRRLHEVAWLFARFWHGFGRLGPRGPEDGPPVLVIPGFVATDRTTMALRKSLAAAGWRVHGWDMGLNRGARADTIERLERRLDGMSGGRPVLLVGWSLGGLFARELARAVPDKVRAVVTLGTPFSGDPKQNNVWRLYEWVAKHKVDEPPIARITGKPAVPHLAVWSRRDGLIACRSARGLDHERDKAVEMACTHMAFGVSGRVARDVVREIALFLQEYEHPESALDSSPRVAGQEQK